MKRLIPRDGAGITATIQEAVALARTTEETVVFSFNGIPLTLTAQKGSGKKAMNEYCTALDARRRLKRQ